MPNFTNTSYNDIQTYKSLKLEAGAKIYLAIPYTGIEQRSYKVANSVTARLLKKGYIVFSPISMFHAIAINHDLPQDFEYWCKLDSVFVEWCDYLMIVNPYSSDNDSDYLNGLKLIEKSKGVQYELKLAENLRKQL